MAAVILDGSSALAQRFVISASVLEHQNFEYIARRINRLTAVGGILSGLSSFT